MCVCGIIVEMSVSCVCMCLNVLFVLCGQVSRCLAVVFVSFHRDLSVDARHDVDLELF